MVNAYDGLCNIIKSYRRKDDMVPLSTLLILKKDCEATQTKGIESDYKDLWDTLKAKVAIYSGDVKSKDILTLMKKMETTNDGTKE